VVPAKVAGTWRLRANGMGQDFDLALKQNFQILEGSLKSDTRDLLLSAAGLRGDRINFSVVDGSVRRDYRGRVAGNTMEGTVRSNNGPEVKWQATRK
jgi:hypothetical protein